MLEALHTRLARAVIECLPYDEFIQRYDRSEILFYLDPPYWGCENDHGKGMFRRDDFQKLAAQLQVINSQFLLSLNDVPEVRELFAAFHVESVTTDYSIGAKKGNVRQKVDEVIISNSNPADDSCRLI